MKHVLPFKQKQIEQRQLEAEADKVARIKHGRGRRREARRIEAGGEADSRRKLADAEAYRLERVGKVDQRADGARRRADHAHPLLIQKTLADKLSDKIQVIIAPPPAGGFFARGLLGMTPPAPPQAGNPRRPGPQRGGSPVTPLAVLLVALVADDGLTLPRSAPTTARRRRRPCFAATGWRCGARGRGS